MSRRRRPNRGNRILALYPSFVLAAAVVGAVLAKPSGHTVVEPPRVIVQHITIPRGIAPAPPGTILIEPPGDRVPSLAVMALHGGGWAGPQPDLISDMEVRGEAWRRKGWAVMIPEYGAGDGGLGDLAAALGELRDRYPGTPVCLYGYSSGAHLALMLAASHPEVRCIVSEAGPTDLPALSRGPSGPAVGYRLAVQAFGERDLAKWSPIRFADRIKASVLQVAAVNDPVIPASQAQSLAPRLSSGSLLILDPGSKQFIHSLVDAGQLQAALSEELSFFAEFENQTPR